MRLKHLSFLGIVLAMLLLFLFPGESLAQNPMAANPLSGKLAVTPAGYDDMGSVLKGMGYSPEEISWEDLANLEKLKNYSAVYINCSGSADEVAEGAATAVKQYVEQGGVIYASDFAESIVNKAFPGKITFYQGGGMLGTESARVGSAGEVEAQLVDAGMAAALGASSIKVNFDLPAWAVMQSTLGRVYMRGPANVLDYSNMNMSDFSGIDFSNPQAVQDLENKMQGGSKNAGDVPYVVSFEEGQGEVLYTSFHNEAQNSAQVSQVLNWFATRTQASRLAKESRNLAQGDEKALLEVVDSINKNEKKTYKFNATGKAAFKIVLNFSGSTIDLNVSNPKGGKVDSKSVSSPPYIVTVSRASSGEYSMEVTGKDVPQANYPFVLTIIGKAEAAAEQQTTNVTTSQNQTGLAKVFNREKLLWYLIGGLLLIGIVIVLIFVLKVRRPAKKDVEPKSS